MEVYTVYAKVTNHWSAKLNWSQITSHGLSGDSMIELQHDVRTVRELEQFKMTIFSISKRPSLHELNSMIVRTKQQ